MNRVTTRAGEMLSIFGRLSRQNVQMMGCGGKKEKSDSSILRDGPAIDQDGDLGGGAGLGRDQELRTTEI